MVLYRRRGEFRANPARTTSFHIGAGAHQARPRQGATLPSPITALMF